MERKSLIEQPVDIVRRIARTEGVGPLDLVVLE